MDSKKVNQLCEKLGYQFENAQLLEQAMTHTSYCSGVASTPYHNERLEFLGDALLELAISEHLMNAYPHLREGTLSQMRAKLVNTESLSQLSNKLGLHLLLQLGRSEEKSGGRKKQSILADAFEALMAAVYLDAKLDFGVIRQLSKHLFQEQIQQLQHVSSLDFKGHLQQYTQAEFQTLPVYQTVKESGADHDKLFEVVVLINDTEHGKGSGKSRKQAELSAAQSALAQLRLST